MRTLTNQTTAISLGYPRTWEPADLTEVAFRIDDTDNNELLDDDTASLYTEAALDVAANRYAREITLEAGSEDLEIGDLIRITGVLGYEDHTVKGYDSDNLVAELEEHVDRDFEAGATVHRLSAVATVDLSDTDTFPPGIQMVITWTPTGTGAPLTELYEIESGLQIDVASFTEEFKALYHRAYKALKDPADRLDTIIRLAQNELRMTLASRLLDIARIKDQRLIAPPLMALVAEMWARDGDKETSDEHQKYTRAYSAALESLCLNPIWVDLDDDGTQDDGEVGSHPVSFERNW